MSLDRKTRAALRAEGQRLKPTVHMGKDGLSDAVVDELDAQLRRARLVKVRLLPSATEGGAGDADHATALAARMGAALVERRGHTVLLYRGPGSSAT